MMKDKIEKKNNKKRLKTKQMAIKKTIIIFNIKN